jgi:hypothetical protein
MAARASAASPVWTLRLPRPLCLGSPDFGGARDFVPKSYRKAVKVMARDTELTVAAARLAVEDAKLVTRARFPRVPRKPPRTPSLEWDARLARA